MTTKRQFRILLALLAGTALLIPVAPAALAAAPPNDDFDDATVIAALPFHQSLDTSDATTAADDPDCAGNGHTVWYAFTPGADMTITANTSGSDFDTTLSAYTGTRGALEQIACNDDSGSLQSRIVFTAAAGTTYFFMVGSFFDSPGGALEIGVAELQPPPNDDFDDATTAPGVPFTNEVDTDLATSDADDPNCNGNFHSVWYSFTPTAGMELQADTFGSSYQTTVSAWTGTRSHLTRVACSGSGRVRFQALAGQTYYFMVGAAFEGEAGHLVFNLRQLPPKLILGLSIDPTGSVSRAGAATVHGTLTCSRAAPGVVILGTIRQPQGKKVAVATFSATVDCVTSVQWSATVAGETAPFRRGDATVVASINYFDEGREDFVSARASRTVRLQ
jgi:hypothetical protein